MAFPKSLFFIACFLVATASVRGQLSIFQSPTSIITGSIRCSNSVFPPLIRNPVNVTLSCDGGRSPLVPPQTIISNFFVIIVTAPTSRLGNASSCAVFAKANVTGCPTLAPGQVLSAAIRQSPIPGFIKTEVFSTVRLNGTLGV